MSSRQVPASDTFGALLRRHRLALGLSQEELADRSGLSVRTIANMERGRTARPHRYSVQSIGDALSLPDSERRELDRAARVPTGVSIQLPATDIKPLAVPHQLPASVPDFVGRTHELEKLTRLVSPASDEGAGAVVISAIGGTAGVGKTALAVHWAHRVAARFPDGQLYVNLRGYDPGQPLLAADALAAFLRALGVAGQEIPADEEERAARYRSLLADRRILIVLDNGRDANHVRPLLPAVKGCAVVITSRSWMPDLASAAQLDLDVLDESESVALFTRIIGPVRAATDMGAVHQVVAACGGLPLAIRIAAARLASRPNWSIAVMASRLADSRRRLDELSAGDLAVRASFLLSYAHLGRRHGPGHTGADRVFRLISLADGPDLSLLAATVLLDTSVHGAERALELLVDIHMLESITPARYRFHDLLRVYAAELAEADEDPDCRHEATRRLLSWYLRTAINAAGLIDPHGHHVALGLAAGDPPSLQFTAYDQALGWLDVEHLNLAAAVRQAASQGLHEIAWKLSVALWDLFNLRGHLNDWLASCRLGLASARALEDPGAEQMVLNHLGAAYLNAGQLAAAIDCLRLRLAIVRQLGDVRSEIATLQNMAVCMATAGQFEGALERMQESVDFHRRSGDRSEEGIALEGLGLMYRRRGNYGESIGCLQQALSAFREIGQLTRESETLVEISMAYLDAAALDAAIANAREAVEISRKAGNRHDEGRAMAVLGRAMRGRGDVQQARFAWAEAFAIFDAAGDPQAADVAADLADLNAQEGMRAVAD